MHALYQTKLNQRCHITTESASNNELPYYHTIIYFISHHIYTVPHHLLYHIICYYNSLLSRHTACANTTEELHGSGDRAYLFIPLLFLSAAESFVIVLFCFSAAAAGVWSMELICPQVKGELGRGGRSCNYLFISRTGRRRLGTARTAGGKI